MRVYGHFHAEIKERVWFCEVHDVKLNSKVLPRVFHLKKEPLSVPIRINIILHKQIVLLVGHFLSQVKVSRFEARLKEQSVICGVDFATAILELPQLVPGLGFQFLFVLYLLRGFVNLFGGYGLGADHSDLVGVFRISRIICSYQCLDI